MDRELESAVLPVAYADWADSYYASLEWLGPHRVASDAEAARAEQPHWEQPSVGDLPRPAVHATRDAGDRSRRCPYQESSDSHRSTPGSQEHLPWNTSSP
ncbi:hypothetical protein [Streptomyces sp. NPDC004685]